MSFDESKFELQKEIKTCDECGSKFYASASKMQSLCPECASILYGYENCDHVFENGRCVKCFWDGSRSEYVREEVHRDMNEYDGKQVWGAILEGGNRRYAFFKEIFSAMGDFQNGYNLFITDIEACAPNDDVYDRLNNPDRCVWISGQELTQIVDEDDFQWIWAVVSGFRQDVEEKDVRSYSKPYADGYKGFWLPQLSMQHPLAEFELVAWDCTLILFFTRNYALYLEFMKQFPDAKDLQKYNSKTDDGEEYEKWLESNA